MGDEMNWSTENLLVEVSECRDKHIHLALKGRAKGQLAFDDFDAFATFIETCQVFARLHSPVTIELRDLFVDDDDEWS